MRGNGVRPWPGCGSGDIRLVMRRVAASGVTPRILRSFLLGRVGKSFGS